MSATIRDTLGLKMSSISLMRASRSILPWTVTRSSQASWRFSGRGRSSYPQKRTEIRSTHFFTTVGSSNRGVLRFCCLEALEERMASVSESLHDVRQAGELTRPRDGDVDLEIRALTSVD